LSVNILIAFKTHILRIVMENSSKTHSNLSKLLIQINEQSKKSLFDCQIDGKKASEHLKDILSICDEKKSSPVIKKKIQFSLKKHK
jgi:hypothetical protein